MNGLNALWKAEVWWIRISSWQYNQITIARSTHSCSMLVDSGNIVIFILSFLYFFAVNLIHFWLLDASIGLGIGIPTDYVQVQSLAKLAFRCFNREGKIFYTPENQTYGTSKWCTHEEKNENIYIQTMISCIQGEFCRDVNVLFPCLFLCLFAIRFPFVFERRLMEGVACGLAGPNEAWLFGCSFSLWEQGLYHLVAGAALQFPCEHMWTRNKSLYPVRFYFLDSDMVD